MMFSSSVVWFNEAVCFGSGLSMEAESIHMSSGSCSGRLGLVSVGDIRLKLRLVLIPRFKVRVSPSPIFIIANLSQLQPATDLLLRLEGQGKTKEKLRSCAVGFHVASRQISNSR